MSRKLSIHESSGSCPDSRVAHLRRLFGSLQYPLSPEGERVLAAAKVGLRLIRKEAPVKKKPGLKKPSIYTGPKVVEENFPDSIREMLKLHRKETNDEHRTQPLRPDHA